MAATNINSEGKVMLPAARDTVTFPSSSGWRITSKADLLNSGSSSRKSTPLCARLTSPGFGKAPPPSNPMSLMVWWGARNGRVETKEFSVSSRPAMLWIFVVSMASSSDSGGMMVGIRLASIDLPEPGGPIINTLWPGDGDFDGAFDVALAFDVAQIDI